MGKLVIYTGPMKSGKSTRLIETYNKVLSKNKRTAMFKPKIDTRWSIDIVSDRNKNSAFAISIEYADDIIDYISLYDNIFIDEFQFLKCKNCTLKYLILTLLRLNKNIWVAGLDLTAERDTFGLMGELCSYATTIYKLKGNCDICGKKSKGIYTFCTKPKMEEILVGDEEYKCVCSKCYEQLYKIKRGGLNE